MTILPDTESPLLILFIGASISIGIASGVAYETVHRLRKLRPEANKTSSQASASEPSSETHILTQWILHQQQQDVQQRQQAMLDSVLDLNRQLTDAYREMALLKLEVEATRTSREES
ncbi:MAG: hypothetical protein ACPG7F_21750 [Aggregatilineales bacterium]